MEYTGKLFGKISNKYFDTGKTSVDYDLLESKLEHCYDLLDNDKNYMYCDNCEKHYDTLEFGWENDVPVCKCGNKINL